MVEEQTGKKVIVIGGRTGSLLPQEGWRQKGGGGSGRDIARDVIKVQPPLR